MNNKRNLGVKKQMWPLDPECISNINEKATVSQNKTPMMCPKECSAQFSSLHRRKQSLRWKTSSKRQQRHQQKKIFCTTNGQDCVCPGKEQKGLSARSSRVSREHQGQKNGKPAIPLFLRGGSICIPVMVWCCHCSSKNHSWRHGWPFPFLSCYYIFEIMNLHPICSQNWSSHLSL